MKYAKDERLEIGRRIYEGELTRGEAASEYGISNETARNYAYLYRDMNRLPNMRQARKAAERQRQAETAKMNLEPAASALDTTPIPGSEEYESMSRDELIRELIRFRVNEARLKKGYEVKGVGATRRFIPIGSGSIR